jgi:4-amino-4-deoxy-L-arabinose transferase-like glycosyltransferase
LGSKVIIESEMKAFLEKPYGYQILLAVIGLLFFLPFLGSVHLFDWDEINFAESSREMLVSKNFFQVQINYEPFMEKPPLFFWLQSLSMGIFGVTEFAARFPNAIFGVLTMLSLFKIGRTLRSEKFGFIWALIYFGSFLPNLYYKSGIIDPVFNYFIFVSIYYLIRLINVNKGKEQNRFAVLSGLFVGLAIITKGPVGLLLLVLAFLVYWAINRFKRVASVKSVLIFIVTIFAVSFLWFGYELVQNGPWFIVEFVKYQLDLFTTPVAGHSQPFYYHFVVVLIGCFPLSIIAIPRFFNKKEQDTKEQDTFEFEKWMKILFWVVMILFSISTTKIVHYSSMAYLPLSYLAATYLFKLHERKLEAKKWMLLTIGFFGFVFSSLLTLLPIILDRKDTWLIPNLKDPFAAAQLSDAIPITGWEFLIGVFYFISIVFGVYFLSKLQVIKSVLVLSISTAFCLLVFTRVMVPKIESFTQGPMIAFYENLKGKDVYVTPVNMKSYAQYFYSEVTPLEENDALAIFKKQLLEEHNANSFNDLTQENKTIFNSQVVTWLMTGNVDKPTYFVVRVHHKDKIQDNPDCEFLYEEGGFAFYKRK